VLDVLRKEYMEAITLDMHQRPSALACSRDLMAVAVVDLAQWSIQIRQCTSDGAYPALRAIRTCATELYCLCFSADGARLAATHYGGVAFFDTMSWSICEECLGVKCRGEKDVAYDQFEGWLVTACNGIVRVDGRELVPQTTRLAFSHHFVASVPSLGLVKVEKNIHFEKFVYLVARPDLVAIRAMSAERVQWMAVVARRLSRL
jgi:hypothetical protein